MSFFPPDTFNYGNMMTTSAPPAAQPIEVPVCVYGFAPGTYVMTDRGEVRIETLDPESTTIGNRDILAVTKSICPDNTVLVFTQGCMGGGIPTRDTYLTKQHIVYNQFGTPMPAEQFLNSTPGVFTAIYEGTALYNILLEPSQRIILNGMFVESLFPDDPLAESCIAKLEAMAERDIDSHHHHQRQRELPPSPQLGMVFTMPRRPMYM